jgi:hypothetical protein
MILFALSPETSDFLTVWGFVVGMLGLIVGVAGFWIAIRQIQEARKSAEASKTAAEAARDAAEATLAESKEAYERFVGAFASRMLAELESAIGTKDWRTVRLRCNDLAELFASLPAANEKSLKSSTEQCVLGLREVSRICAGLEAKRSARMPKHMTEKWSGTLQLAHGVLDHLRKPFREVRHGEIADRDPTPTTPTDGGRAAREDEGSAGELGSGS